MGPEEEREHLELPFVEPTDLTTEAVREAFERVKQQLSTYTVTVGCDTNTVEIPQTFGAATIKIKPQTTSKFKVRRCSNWK